MKLYIAALILAIMGLLLGLIPFFGWLAIPINLIAVILGIIGILRKKQISSGNFNMAVASLILGAIPLVLKFMLWH